MIFLASRFIGADYGEGGLPCPAPQVSGRVHRDLVAACPHLGLGI